MFRLPSLPPLWRLVTTSPAEKMDHEHCRVDGRTFGYGIVEGSGPLVVLVHGWGLAHHSYRPAAETIAAQGYRVVVPDLPGFGESSELSLLSLSLPSYAAAVARFLEECPEVGGEPCHLVGHSFGGAVAAQLAHDHPALVSSVVLVSSVSGATWQRQGEVERLLSERPLWDWGVHLVSEFPVGRFPRGALGVFRDLSHNLVWHPASLGLVARLIRRSDLRGELAKVREQEIPVAVVWAEGDRVVTRACFDDQCGALGIDGTVVPGNHGWPLSDPDSFGHKIGEILGSMEPTAPLAK